jgi:hypothetical protein
MVIGSNNIISTKRLVTAAGKKTFPVGFLLTNIPVYLEQLDPQTAAMLNDIPAFNQFRAIAYEVLDVIDGDKVIDAQAKEYIVSGVQHYENNPEVDNHTEIILLRKFPDA